MSKQEGRVKEKAGERRKMGALWGKAVPREEGGVTCNGKDVSLRS